MTNDTADTIKHNELIARRINAGTDWKPDLHIDMKQLKSATCETNSAVKPSDIERSSAVTTKALRKLPVMTAS